MLQPQLRIPVSVRKPTGPRRLDRRVGRLKQFPAAFSAATTAIGRPATVAKLLGPEIWMAGKPSTSSSMSTLPADIRIVPHADTGKGRSTCRFRRSSPTAPRARSPVSPLIRCQFTLLLCQASCPGTCSRRRGRKCRPSSPTRATGPCTTSGTGSSPFRSKKETGFADAESSTLHGGTDAVCAGCRAVMGTTRSSPSTRGRPPP